MDETFVTNDPDFRSTPVSSPSQNTTPLVTESENDLNFQKDLDRRANSKGSDPDLENKLGEIGQETEVAREATESSSATDSEGESEDTDLLSSRVESKLKDQLTPLQSQKSQLLFGLKFR